MSIMCVQCMDTTFKPFNFCLADAQYTTWFPRQNAKPGLRSWLYCVAVFFERKLFCVTLAPSLRHGARPLRSPGDAGLAGVREGADQWLRLLCSGGTPSHQAAGGAGQVIACTAHPFHMIGQSLLCSSAILFILASHKHVLGYSLYIMRAHVGLCLGIYSAK